MRPATDETWMRRALALARRGIPAASPNPFVGCVLVRGGRAVGEGWHAAYGGPHAEAAALAKAGLLARGATAYVTLEPCCHLDKKTPPCVPALAAAGVRRVVAGVRDPNPAVSGKGLRALRAAGVKTALGALEKECAELNRPFFTRIRRKRPYVILKAAASLDGRVETAGGESRWITSPQARRFGHRLRASADAIVVGVETVLKDDPALTAHGEGRDPLRVVLDTRLRVPQRARVLRTPGADTVVFTAKRHGKRPGRLSPRASTMSVPMNGRGLDLHAVLRSLEKLGVGTVLVEGGSAVHTSFLHAGLVDELRLFLAPKLLGGASARGFFEGAGIARLARALRVRELRAEPVGPDLLLTGYL